MRPDCLPDLNQQVLRQSCIGVGRQWRVVASSSNSVRETIDLVLDLVISKDAAWRSKARLTVLGTSSWVLPDVEVSPIEMTFLD
jgi:hypothetical protein